MNFLSGLHGAVALALLPALLFAEEAGVPLPFAPGELVLLVAGLLIASGGLNPYAFIPLSLVACIAGSLVGYSWARAVGDRGLKGLARRLRQQRNLERVEDRLRAAGWRGIAISRLIPGLRIYTTLVAGAVRAPRRSFILAMVSSTFVWVGVYVALGILIGVPVEHFLDQLQKLAVQGAILIVMGVGCYLAGPAVASTVSGIAGFAGSLFAVQQQGINNGSFTADINITMFSMVVIGGLGSISGAIMGALYLEGLPAIFGSNQTIQFITSGLGLIAFILYLPGGLAELLRRFGDLVAMGIRFAQERLTSRHAEPPVASSLAADGAEQ